MTPIDRWNDQAPRVLYLGSAPTLGDGAIGDGLLGHLRRVWPGLALRILTSTPRFYAALPNAAGARLQAKPELRVQPPAGPAPNRGRRLPSPLQPLRTLRRLRALSADRVDHLPADVAELWRRTYGWADLVVHQGGPQWNDRWLGPGSLRFHAHRLAAGRGPGRPLALLGQGCGPFRWDGGPRAALRRRFARHLLAHCTAIVTRDAAGAASLEGLGLARETVFAAADAALLITPGASPRSHDLRRFLAQQPKPVLAVALRSMRRQYPGLESREPELRRRLAHLLDLAAERFSLVALSTGGEADRRALAAVEALREGEAVALPPELPFTSAKDSDGSAPSTSSLTPAEMAHVYAGCRLLLAVRLHPAILAATAGVPSVSLPYDAKGHHFAAQAGLEEFTHPLIDLSPPEAAASLFELDRRRQQEAARLEDAIEGLRRRTATTLDAACQRLEAAAREESAESASSRNG